MQVVKTSVPVQALFCTATVKDARRPGATRAGRFQLKPHRHREMGADGVYYFFVGFNPDTGAGGYVITLRSHVVEGAYPRVRHTIVHPSWTAIYNLAMDSGATESYIAPMQHPQGGETHRHT